jgi:adenosylcobinamide-phosphate synthase
MSVRSRRRCVGNALVALVALGADRLFGEFRFIRHPVRFMGDYILWFEKRFYKDSILRGALLTVSLLLVAGGIACGVELFAALLPGWGETLLLGVLSSLFVAHRMLHDAVLEVVTAENPREKVAMLVSRDTDGMDESGVCKAAVETYAENLSDGVVAPLFYLLLFGFTGIVLYKAANTLDSMVGYRNPRYLRFGRVSARLDDVLNYLPARITALMIVLFSKNGRRFWNNGHESPNAGQPITAMALVLGVKLGGPTSYGGVVKPKPWFGRGREAIAKADVLRALRFRDRIDLMLTALLGSVALL